MILNQVGSPTTRSCSATPSAPSVPVLGALPHDDALHWRDRHLGLVPVAEQPDDVAPLPRTAGRRGPPPRRSRRRRGAGPLGPLPATRPVPLPAPGPARSGSRWPAARPSPSPTPTPSRPWRRPAPRSCPSTLSATSRLPEAIDGLVVGGGFPEVYAAALSANRPLLDDDPPPLDAGLPTWAECGGLLLLARIPRRASHGRRRCRPRHHDRPTDPWLPAGGDHHGLAARPGGHPCRGHEFHYSTLSPRGRPCC